MARSHHFEAPTGEEIRETLGASVYFVLSDMPWSFSVTADSGEAIRVYVSELPDTVDVDVVVETGDGLVFRSCRGRATRLLVAATTPHIVVESGSADSRARLEITLSPRLVIRDTVGRPPT